MKLHSVRDLWYFVLLSRLVMFQQLYIVHLHPSYRTGNLLELQQIATKGKLKSKFRTECAKSGCPGRLRNVGAVRTKPLFFPRPNVSPGIWRLRLLLGAEQLISQGFMEEQTIIVDGIIALHSIPIHWMETGNACCTYYMFRLKRQATSKVSFFRWFSNS